MLYLATLASTLALTQSGDWGLGWIRLVHPGLALAASLGVFAFSSLLAGVTLVRWRTAAPDIRAIVPGAAIAFGVVVFLGTVLRPTRREYVFGLALTATTLATHLLLLMAIASSITAQRARAIWDWLAEPHPRLPWVLAGWTLAIASALSWTTFERIPHVPDEVAYWFQARYFAAGVLSLPAPPDPAAFEIPHTLLSGGRWFSIFPPGWPAVLSLGFLAGVPWIVNPALGAATIVLTNRLVKDLYNHRVAVLTVLLLAASPMFLLMSAGLMSHPLSVVLALGAIIGWREMSEGHLMIGLAGAAALGGLVLTRPYEGVILASVLGVWSLFSEPTVRVVTRGAAFFAVAIAIGALMLPYNRMLTGRALYDPVSKYFDEKYYPGSNRLGFGADVGNTGWNNDLRKGHSAGEAVLNGRHNTYLLNLELLGWGVGSLAGVALFGVWGRWSRADAFMASVAAAIVGGLSLYWYSGADYGARYWYQAAVPLIVLSARGLDAAASRVASLVASAAGRVLAAAGAASLAGVLLVVPWRAITKYHHYRGMNASVRDLIHAGAFGDGLVLVRGAGDATPFARYSAAGIFNAPLPGSAGPVFARDLGPASRHAVECAFPGRPVLLLDTSRLPDQPAVLIESQEPPACR